jgi:type IV pili sensor histidine kinase/response regulator
MTHRTVRFHRAIAIAICAGGLLCGSVAGLAKEMTIARYSTLTSVPTEEQLDVLAAPVTQVLPSNVTRIGEAIAALLEPSGYRLAPALAAPVERNTLLALRLPEVHRDLEGIPLRSALKTLAGPAFMLVEDPVHRLVSFERCDNQEEDLSSKR